MFAGTRHENVLPEQRLTCVCVPNFSDLTNPAFSHTFSGCGPYITGQQNFSWAIALNMAGFFWHTHVSQFVASAVVL